ncbi:MAG TPA: hypothetical protein PKE40_00740 [Arachnia sp.]|nr:hypothetical protein [Arachnia sp.]HMT84853.1 hypothetical protein [Arachnia sp.]
MTDDTEAGGRTLQHAFALLRRHGVMRIETYPAALLEALGISPSAPTEAVREYVRSRLLRAADRLRPQECGTAFKIVAGLCEGYPDDTDGRLRKAADEIGRSDRTVRRYYDEAAKQIPALLDRVRERSVSQEVDYAFVYARTRVDLREETPYIVNERTISVRSDWIDHVDEQLVLPNFTGDMLDIRALEGCRVESVAKSDHGAWRFRLVFPRALRAGERHAFATSIKLPSRDTLAPVAGFAPRNTSYDALLELRFGARRPAVLERFVASPLAETPLRSELIKPVEARHDFLFRQMQAGFWHGVRWRWDGDFLPTS